MRNWLVMMKLASTCPNSDMGVIWGLLCLHPNTTKRKIEQCSELNKTLRKVVLHV